MTRWLVTGGCGFIGRNLIAALLQDPANDVRVLDNLTVGRISDLQSLAPVRQLQPAECSAHGDPGVIGLLVGDVRDGEIDRIAAQGRDVIVHLAGNTGVAPSIEDPLADCTANVLGTLGCLEAARHAGVRRFVFASSGAPLGAVEPPVHENKAPRPVSPYGASKLAAEGYCSAYFQSFGIDTVALRFGNVYGPGSAHKSSVIAAFVGRALLGAPLEIYGDGTQTRDFIYVGDLLRAIRLAASVPEVGGEIFQIASARETTVIELAELLVSLLRARGIEGVEIVRRAARLGDVQRNYADTRKAAARLGWQPEVGLADGLTRVIDWFLAQRQSAPVSAAAPAPQPVAQVTA